MNGFNWRFLSQWISPRKFMYGKTKMSAEKQMSKNFSSTVSPTLMSFGNSKNHELAALILCWKIVLHWADFLFINYPLGGWLRIFVFQDLWLCGHPSSRLSSKLNFQTLCSFRGHQAGYHEALTSKVCFVLFCFSFGEEKAPRGMI